MLTYIKGLFKKKSATELPPVEPPKVEPPKPAEKEKDIWDKNIAAFEESWKLWTSQQPAHRKPIMLREAYRTIDGTVYFEYADISDFPVIRSQKAAAALLTLTFAVTPDYIEELQKKVLAAVANGDHNEVLRLNSDFFNRNKLAPEIPTMIELSSLFLIRHDENPYSFNPIIHTQKLKAAANNYELQAFFLHASWELVKIQVPQFLEVWKIGKSKDFQDYLAGKIPTR